LGGGWSEIINYLAVIDIIMSAKPGLIWHLDLAKTRSQQFFCITIDVFSLLA
jgi:general stress protein CsbA